MTGSSPADGTLEVPSPLADRLFPDIARKDLTLGHSRSLVLARLLEDGDHNDLAWLFAALPEAEIANWLKTQGGRKLSRRSAAYWQTVLGIPSAAPTAGRADLWPL